jgi:hypothetical protein
MLVSTQKPGVDGFPVAVVQLWNNSSDEVLFEYQAGCLTFHCGQYEQRGPADLFGRRRQILDPQQEINFTLPAGRWSQTPTTGPQDLMLPSELAPGRYPIWATLKLAGASGEAIESDRDKYEVRPPAKPATKPAQTESFRPAEAGDFQATLATRADASDHFPLATIKIYNTSKDSVIVSYEPQCIMLHCGPYEKSAPPLTFVQRREILRPKEPLEFELDSGDWRQSAHGSERDLMLPTTLPSGKYETWATFRLSGTNGPTVQTPHDWFVVP